MFHRTDILALSSELSDYLTGALMVMTVVIITADRTEFYLEVHQMVLTTSGNDVLPC